MLGILIISVIQACACLGFFVRWHRAACLVCPADLNHITCMLRPGLHMQVFACHLAAVAIDGCSINPARSFGPAVTSGTPTHLPGTAQIKHSPSAWSEHPLAEEHTRQLEKVWQIATWHIAWTHRGCQLGSHHPAALPSSTDPCDSLLHAAQIPQLALCGSSVPSQRCTDPSPP